MTETSKIDTKIWFSIMVFFIPLNTLISQENSDFETWSSVGITYKPIKRLTLDLQEQLRLKTNSSEIDTYFTQIDANCKIWGGLSLGGGFRYIRKNDNQGKKQGYENHFRFHLNASYKHSINNLTLKYRFRYQNKNELGISTADGDFANQHFRFKIAIKYNIANWKFDPKISAEIFNHFEEGEDNGFDKFRFSLGTDYKLKTLGKIGLFFRIEKELNEETPTTTNILGLKYIYTIKHKKLQKNRPS